MRAIIMRGLPGSGKTTRARELAGEKGVIHSTDDYFFVGGIYVHDWTKLKEYHSSNLRAFKTSLAARISVVICDNTNVKHWEYEPYVRAAEQAGYEVEVITLPHLSVEILHTRSTHNTPVETIQKMLDHWEP